MIDRRRSKVGVDCDSRASRARGNRAVVELFARGYVFQVHCGRCNEIRTADCEGLGAARRHGLRWTDAADRWRHRRWHDREVEPR